MIKYFINEESTNTFIEKYNKQNLNDYDKESIVFSILDIDEKLINLNIQDNIFKFLINDLFLAKQFLIHFSNLSLFYLQKKLIDNISIFDYKDILKLINSIDLSANYIKTFFNETELDKLDIDFVKSNKFHNLSKLSLKDKLKIENKIGHHISLMYFTKDYDIKEKNEIIEFLTNRYSLYSKKQLHHLFKNNLFIYDINHLTYLYSNFTEVFQRISKYINKDTLIEVEKEYFNINLKNF